MKKIFLKLYHKTLLLAVMTIVLILSSIALAQEDTTVSPTPSTSINAEKIQDLKDKLATKVAELRENQTRGFLGEIASKNSTSFTLVTAEEKEVKVRYSEDTFVYDLTGSKKTEKKLTDLTNLQSAAVIGLYDATENILSAKSIYLQNMYLYFTGEVVVVDKDNATLTIKQPSGSNKVIDYEKTTKADEFVEEKLVKSGLSRINAGDRLHIWGKISDNDNQKISAVRILRLPAELFGATEGAQTATYSALPQASTKE